jgi:hypothetical protein
VLRNLTNHAFEGGEVNAGEPKVIRDVKNAKADRSDKYASHALLSAFKL